jgi:spore maturation protein CgeB
LAKIRAKKTREQIKARHFEINACGAFQLSYYVNGLERCYAIGEEIGVYLDPDDLVDRVRIYLEDDGLRERIAGNALRRTLSDHSYSARFKALFAHMGLPEAQG